MKKFAERLRMIQEQRGWTQSQLSEVVGISQGTISAYLNDQKSPTIDTAKNIATALGVSIGWLCGETEIQTLRGHSVKYSQLLTLLHELIDIDFINGGFSVDVASDDSKETSFTTKDEIVTEVFSAILRARRLYINGDLDREMYDAIVEKYIDKYSGQTVPVAGVF